MKEFLSQASQPFVVRMVDEEDEAYRELVAMGVRSVPATVIDGQIIRGFDPMKLRDAIAARSTPDR